MACCLYAVYTPFILAVVQCQSRPFIQLLYKPYGYLHPVFIPVFISFDPEIDTKERLKAYVTGFNPEFVGITGDQPEVIKLGYQLGVERLAPMENHMNQRIISHTNHLIVVNQDAEVIGIFRGPFESSNMALVIKSLLRKI